MAWPIVIVPLFLENALSALALGDEQAPTTWTENRIFHFSFSTLFINRKFPFYLWILINLLIVNKKASKNVFLPVIVAVQIAYEI